MNRKFSTKKNERGQGLVEYALIFTLVGVVCIGALMAFGPQIKVIATSMIGSAGNDFSVQNGELIINGISASHTPTNSPIPGASPTATASPTPTESPTPTNSPTPTYTPTQTYTLTPTSTATATSSPTATQTYTAVPTNTPIPTNTPVPTNTPTPTATPIGTWETCASENGFCSFSGTAQVRYGANGTWVTQIHTDGVSCTNTVFGDPVYGVAKTCQYYQITVATPTPTPTSTPTSTPVPEWTYCADQGGVCSFTGTYAVRFGKNTTWVTQIHTDGVACTKSIFGNPISGAKTCEIYR